MTAAATATPATTTLHPCARCASMQKTCCQRAEILTTSGDIKRIETHIGSEKRHDFWSFRAPTDPSYAEPDPEDPNWVRYTTDDRGMRRVLNRRENGDCIFLGPAGCVLPTEVRPLVCRLYPFAYTERGLTGIDDGYCPSAALIPEPEPGQRKGTMLTVLSMSALDAERWRRGLYAELRDDWRRRCTSV